MNTLVISGILVDEKVTLSKTEVCQKLNISEELLMEMIEHGLLNQKVISNPVFDHFSLRRIEAVHRLLEDLEVNVAGAILALELLDHLSQLEEEVAILERQLGG